MQSPELSRVLLCPLGPPLASEAPVGLPSRLGPCLPAHLGPAVPSPSFHGPLPAILQAKRSETANARRKLA